MNNCRDTIREKALNGDENAAALLAKWEQEAENYLKEDKQNDVKGFIAAATDILARQDAVTDETGEVVIALGAVCDKWYDRLGLNPIATHDIDVTINGEN